MQRVVDGRRYDTDKDFGLSMWDAAQEAVYLCDVSDEVVVYRLPNGKYWAWADLPPDHTGYKIAPPSGVGVLVRLGGYDDPLFKGVAWDEWDGRDTDEMDKETFEALAREVLKEMGSAEKAGY